MLDYRLTQGAGLHALGSRSGPRVITIVSHGDPQSELPLLFNLCTALVRLDAAPVAVLDGSTAESTDNPGLAQLLIDSYRPFDVQNNQPAWDVIPAATGLQKLCKTGRSSRTHHSTGPAGTSALRELGGVFESAGVVVIYASAEVLIRLLADSGGEPLLPVSASRTSRVSAYQALKRMLLTDGLRPTIATMVHQPVKSAISAGLALSRNLQDCAMYFLGYQLDAFTLSAEPSGETSSPDMHRLALGLLERAKPLQTVSFMFGQQAFQIPAQRHAHMAGGL